MTESPGSGGFEYLCSIGAEQVLVRAACTGEIVAVMEFPQKEDTVVRQIAASLDVKAYREQGQNRQLARFLPPTRS